MTGNTNSVQNEFPPVVMSIAEFDPSGQAGTIADIKTLAAHNCYGVAAVTALTLQRPGGNAKIQPLAPAWLKESIISTMQSYRVRAIKVGLLCDQAGAEALCEILDSNPSVPMVLDPVLPGDVAYGNVGTEPEIVKTLLLRRATVVTSSPIEASTLTGLPVRSPAEMKTAAAKLVEMGARSAVVTGGRFEKPFDVYFDRDHSATLAGERFKVNAPHETGSTFSSAIAANLALGRQPHDAVVMAKAFVTEGLRKAFTTASGTVLLNHFYRAQQPARVVDSQPEVAEQVR